MIRILSLLVCIAAVMVLGPACERHAATEVADAKGVYTAATQSRSSGTVGQSPAPHSSTTVPTNPGGAGPVDPAQPTRKYEEGKPPGAKPNFFPEGR